MRIYKQNSSASFATFLIIFGCSHLDSSFGSTVWRADVGCAKEDVVEAIYRKVVKSVHSDRGHVADAQPLQVAVERRNRFCASAE